MNIIHSCGKYRTKKIIKTVNHYWYDICPSSAEEKNKLKRIRYNHSVFSCHEYTFSISPYSLNIWCSEHINETSKVEIKTFLDLIFTDNGKVPKKSVRGYFSEASPHEKWLVDMLSGYGNIYRHKPNIPCGHEISRERIDECIQFMQELDVSVGQEYIRKSIVDILNTVKINR